MESMVEPSSIYNLLDNYFENKVRPIHFKSLLQTSVFYLDAKTVNKQKHDFIFSSSKLVYYLIASFVHLLWHNKAFDRTFAFDFDLACYFLEWRKIVQNASSFYSILHWLCYNWVSWNQQRMSYEMMMNLTDKRKTSLLSLFNSVVNLRLRSIFHCYVFVRALYT